MKYKSKISKNKYLAFITLIVALLIGCKKKQHNENDFSKKESKTNLRQKPKITILGTFHFDATNDYASTQIDSLFSNKRQIELDKIVDEIVKYKPTKIMVEWEPKTKKELDDNLKKYLKGDFKLPRNEIYQIGFRLAKKANIKELFPIDFQMNLGDENLVDYLNKIDKFSSFEEIINDLKETASDETKYLKSHSISEFYKKINSKENDDFNRNIYLERIPSISYESNNPLVKYTSNWYKRNIIIMGQIDSQIKENDRVFLLIGGGHRAILKDLYINRSNIKYIEINEYLE